MSLDAEIDALERKLRRLRWERKCARLKAAFAQPERQAKATAARVLAKERLIALWADPAWRAGQMEKMRRSQPARTASVRRVLAARSQANKEAKAVAWPQQTTRKHKRGRGVAVRDPVERAIFG